MHSGAQGLACFAYPWCILLQMSDLMFLPWPSAFLQYLVPLLLEKGSLGLGLDAPKLEISQVVPGSPENELCAAMTFCFAMTSYPDSENWLEMLFHQYEVTSLSYPRFARVPQLGSLRSRPNGRFAPSRHNHYWILWLSHSVTYWILWHIGICDKLDFVTALSIPNVTFW